VRDEFPIVNRRIGSVGEPRPAQVITCSECGGVDALSAHKGRKMAEHVAGTFTQRGWIVGAVGKHLCPACIGRRRAARKNEREKATMAKEAEKESAKTPPERSPEASASIADMYLILSDAYDRAAKNYRPGWSDARIAKETGLSLAFVARRREDAFGPVVIDTTFEDFATELAGIASALVDIAREHEAQAMRIRRCAERSAKLDMLGRAILARHNAGRAA
jgi:hypothetical protein